MLEAAQLAQEITPFIAGAVGAYGSAVLTRVEDSAAEATVSFGQRVLHRLTGRGAVRQGPDAEQDAVIAAVVRLAGDPADPALLAALREQISTLLHTDPEIAAEIAALPRPEAPAQPVTITASGARSIAVQRATGILITGDTSYETAP
ncbi:hypothetical protein [Streptomyces sp. NPDC005336]|uniref:hypothetical protein n=1 Tax=unclassified Streptomyces TaxID=2593676 RepID=UPI0033B38F31